MAGLALQSTARRQAESAGVRPEMASWHQGVNGLTGLGGLVQELGGDRAALLRSVGLAADALDRSHGRIAYRVLGLLLHAAERQTHHPQLGLVAGRLCRLEDLGDLGEIVRHSDCVAAALEALVAFQHLHGEGGLLFFARRGAIAELGYAIYYPGIEGASQIYDYMLASMHGFLRELCGPTWQASEVFVPHRRPDSVNHYRLLFKTQPHFDSELCALRFPAYWLDRRVECAAAPRCAAAIGRALRADKPDFIQRVYRALRLALIRGKTSGDDVAQMLSMHRRTLNRRLRARGATFQSVLDDVRLEVARQLLVESDAALDDIAAALGYAGVSGFMRRYKDRTGMTPASARRAALAAARETPDASRGDGLPVHACGKGAHGFAAPLSLVPPAAVVATRYLATSAAVIFERPSVAALSRAKAGCRCTRSRARAA
jgi:AraC-like DNA-binding protein